MSEKPEFTVDSIHSVPVAAGRPARSLNLQSDFALRLLIAPDYEITIRRKDGNQFQLGDVIALCDTPNAAATASAKWE